MNPRMIAVVLVFLAAPGCLDETVLGEVDTDVAGPERVSVGTWEKTVSGADLPCSELAGVVHGQGLVASRDLHDRLLGLRWYDATVDDGCTISPRDSAQTLVVLAAGGLFMEADQLRLARRHVLDVDVDELQALISSVGLHGLAERLRIDSAPLQRPVTHLQALHEQSDLAFSEQPLRASTVLYDDLLVAAELEPGDTHLDLEVSFTRTPQHEYSAFMVAGQTRAFMRHRGLHTILPRIVIADRYHDDELRFADQARRVWVPLADIQARVADPRAVPLEMVRPGLLDRGILTAPTLQYGDVTAATLAHALQVALGLLLPDFDLDDLICGEQRECCDTLVEGVQAALPSLWSVDNDVEGAVVSAARAFLAAGFEDPDDPGEPGWITACVGDVLEEGVLGRLRQLVEFVAELFDLVENLAELSHVVVALTVGPTHQHDRTLNLCLLACGAPDCVWDDGTIACQAPPQCASDADCDDANPCTRDLCSDGQCVPTGCTDGQVCVQGIGCRTAQCRTAADCDDGNVCNGAEACQGRRCVAGVPRECGPRETCDPARGCVQTADCTEGACCDIPAGRLRSRGVACGPASERYLCAGQCGGTLQVETTQRFCDGVSPRCEDGFQESNTQDALTCPQGTACLTEPATCSAERRCGERAVFWHPDATLVRVDGRNEVYLLQNGRKRYVHWHDQINDWFRLGWDVVISGEELDCYGDGPDFDPADEVHPELVVFRRQGSLWAYYHGVGYAPSVARVDDRLVDHLLVDGWGRPRVIVENPDTAEQYWNAGTRRAGYAPFRPATPLRLGGDRYVVTFGGGLLRLDMTEPEIAAAGYILSDFIRLPTVPLDRIGDVVDVLTADDFADTGHCGPQWETRACYDGPGLTRGVGACRDGEQRIDRRDPNGRWSACTGQVLPADEDCDNGRDDDCDGRADDRDDDCRVPICEPGLHRLRNGRCDRCADGGFTWSNGAAVDDGNPCTDDVCDPERGVRHLPALDGLTCDDGDPDTQRDACRQGQCVGQRPVCEPRRWRPAEGGCERCQTDGFGWEAPVALGGDDCQRGRCDAVRGPVTDPEPDGTRCDDGRQDTANDRCEGGVCVGDCVGPAQRDCGNCGSQSRACVGGRWSPWTTCGGAGVCAPGEQGDCDGGNRTCTDACVWGACRCEAQDLEHDLRCDGDRVRWYDECDNARAVVRSCEHGCQDGQCLGCEGQNPRVGRICGDDGHSWWVNECGEPTGVSARCLHGCEDGACAPCEDGACSIRFSPDDNSVVQIDCAPFALHDGTPLCAVANAGDLCAIFWAQGEPYHHEQGIRPVQRDGDLIEVQLPDVAVGDAPYLGCQRPECGDGRLPLRYQLIRCSADNLEIAAPYLNVTPPSAVGRHAWWGYDDQCERTGSLGASFDGVHFWASGGHTEPLSCPARF